MKLTGFTLELFYDWIKENKKNVQQNNEDDLIIEWFTTIDIHLTKRNDSDNLYILDIENYRYLRKTKTEAIEQVNKIINRNNELIQESLKEIKKRYK
ncbi:hypothetical protein [Empedobacter sp.]|uniref:hypothetical protein n=1 Tax=Empedobacter sp. TaxID=1927715 RepID=UPI00289EB201|nr:hypothetical protein [Empedobacter sp.]